MNYPDRGHTRVSGLQGIIGDLRDQITPITAGIFFDPADASRPKRNAYASRYFPNWVAVFDRSEKTLVVQRFDVNWIPPDGSSAC